MDRAVLPEFAVAVWPNEPMACDDVFEYGGRLDSTKRIGVLQAHKIGFASLHCSGKPNDPLSKPAGFLFGVAGFQIPPACPVDRSDACYNQVTAEQTDELTLLAIENPGMLAQLRQQLMMSDRLKSANTTKIHKWLCQIPQARPADRSVFRYIQSVELSSLVCRIRRRQIRQTSEVRRGSS